MFEAIGALVIITLGCLGHFIYDWTDHKRASAIFFAVNESTWEHIKLTIYPGFLFMVAAVVRYGGNPCLLPAQAAAMLTPMLLIPFLFYGYTLFTKKNYLIVDILCFCLSVCAGMWVFRLIISSGYDAPNAVKAASALCLLAIAAMYFSFSFNPPHNFLFRDPITRRYGLSGHPCMHNHKHHPHGVRHPEVKFGKPHHDEQQKLHDENLEFLRKTPKVYFVAMKSELDADSTSSEVVYMGVGKARSTRALLKWIQANRQLIIDGNAPLIVSLGTAGSGKHMRGEILLCEKFANNGDSFIDESIEFDVLPQKTPYICASSDFFINEENFDAGKVSTMREKYDCMEMEAFALANICREAGLKFCAVKCVSDGADESVANFDVELPKFRAKLNEFVKQIDC